VDRIFARLGASDDLLEGESTFMVEMREAAHIVSRAGERSLLLIDEIGRGTATLDGLAVAQAILEWIVTELRSRTLFATHFHELTGLSESLSGVGNLSVGSTGKGDDVVFTHEIRDGPANKSYGLEVAKLAGLPPHLIDRARELLAEGEARESVGKGKRGSRPVPQLSLFSRAERPAAVPGDYQRLKAAVEELRAADLDNVTPMQGLALLSRLKAELKKDS
jgi:DNA mismatch repair protein MutS